MGQPLRVLIAEDNAADAELLVRELRRGGFNPEWERVDCEADYLERLGRRLDVILSDYEMPQFGGLRALELLRERGLDVPFIIVSGTIGEETAVAAMQQGAADYLLKDRLGRLGPAIARALEIARTRRERRQTEARIHEQAAMLDHAHDAIIVRGLNDLRITYWNRGAERLYGWTAEEAIGRNIGELLFVDPTVPPAVSHHLAEAGEWNGEHRQRCKDGRELVVRGHATLVLNAQGDRSVLVINFDITHQKLLEAQILRAQRMESIGTLASGLAHDLNNILAPIMMSVPLLRRDLGDAQRAGIVETIEKSAARGAQIVRQVLTFGRGVEGERQALDLREVIGELRQIIGETFPRGIAVEIACEPALLPVMGDATQFHQVLLNLAVNARDAMNGSGTLRISAGNLTADEAFVKDHPQAAVGSYVRVEVSDTGTGIPPEFFERIFEPFFTTKGVGAGTGLGLSTAFGIVNSHGGFIEVTSTPGAGASFHVFLPAAGRPEVDGGTTRKAEPPPHGREQLVLVVDDEHAVLHTAEKVLRDSGYQVLLATDGVHALTLFAVHSHRIAAVVTDVMMPNMNGVALTRALRQLRPALPIIASTGLGDAAERAELRALGVVAILDKPFGADTLLTAINHAMT